MQLKQRLQLSEGALQIVVIMANADCQRVWFARLVNHASINATRTILERSYVNILLTIALKYVPASPNEFKIWESNLILERLQLGILRF